MPGLLTLKTNLKSLRYGQDQPGGGDSGLPYIKTDINTVDRDFNRLRLTKFDDGLVRGGTIGVLNAAATDTLRISKFFTDFPKGPLFIIKQVGLQLSNPRLEVPKNPSNIISGTPDNVLAATTNGLLQPTRIYNLGINTISQIPVNAFGIHFNRHGLLPVQNENSKYEAVANANNFIGSNRLLGLTNKFKLGDRKVNTSINSRLTNFINQITSVIGSVTGTPIPSLNINRTETIIDDYIAGPSSVYGIGRTLIKRYNNTEDGIRITESLRWSNIYSGKTRDDKGNVVDVNYTSDLGKGSNAISNYRDGISTESNEINTGVNNSVIGSVKTYANLKKQIDKTTKSQLEYINSSPNAFSLSDNYVGEQLPSSNNLIEYKNTYNETIKINMSWKNGTRERRIGSERQDSINLTPLFRAETGTYRDKVFIPGVGEKNIRDLAKFRIQSINTDKPSEAVWMIFRAYLTNISDDVSAEWTDIKYAGRGDKFYVYNGFTRKIGISFKVAALSYDEMKPMYQKLNYLMGNLMPDYSNDNLMRGPLVRMTIGNYIDGQLGILESVSYKISQDSPWEIAMSEPERGMKTLVLPHIVEVDLRFTPIGSQTRELNELSRKSDMISNIAQNWNGKGEENEFINPDRSSIVSPTGLDPEFEKQLQTDLRQIRTDVSNEPTPSLIN